MSKPYMPLMMGDWVRGTRAMKAQVKGVYIGLLIHQYDAGYLPADLDTLALIEPEVGYVWVILKDKFEEFEPGKLRNKKLEEVRGFWSKQSKNGQKGGRPKKNIPEHNPNNNPKANPNTNHHNDLDHDNVNINLIKIESDFDQRFKNAFDGITMNIYANNYRNADVSMELDRFKVKCQLSPEEYQTRDTTGLRLAFQHQLKTARREVTPGISTTRPPLRTIKQILGE